MSVELNHTIIRAADREASARYLTEVLGLPQPTPFGPFLLVDMANGVSLAFMTDDAPITAQHYAFLISEGEFDGVFARVRATGQTYWADPARQRENEINSTNGGRGFYFCDPSGHFLEVLTQP
jgi:catechol 2,3-dioxygenase-like lactoylglutathione lyase family enzyme